MRGEHLNPEGHDDRTPHSVGALIRAAADGELTDEQIAAFERLCAQRDCTEDRVKFEQTLRATCGRVMQAPACPEALRARILTLAAADQSGQTQAAQTHAAETQPAADGPEAIAPYTRQRSFWLRSPAMAAAAVVLLSVAGVLIWQAANMPGLQPPAGMTTQQVDFRDRVAGFVAEEHNRCCRSDKSATDKLVYRDIEAARDHLTEVFGRSDFTLRPVADAPAGSRIEFWGGGDCRVPGYERSAHLRFDATDPAGNDIRLSLFIMPDNQRLPLKDGVTYRLNAEACSKAGVRAYAWRADGLIHLLVSEASGDFCSAVRNLFQAPRTLAGL
ncbi:MAG: hypothetical protein LAT64_13610 [Phycisphaerales bacterium]|nr:hypothetical protein [Planctomycetota bacterium]MCH8509790.1 hypothetical protein [Phycisphaerales bacterium]